MSLISELSELGVDTESAFKRFMNNEKLYERMLKKFANTAPQLEVAAYLEGGDPNKAVDNAHTLKGVTGNLSIMPLYTAYTEIVNLLRQGQENEAAEVLKEILPIQEEIISCIKAYE